MKKLYVVKNGNLIVFGIVKRPGDTPRATRSG